MKIPKFNLRPSDLRRVADGEKVYLSLVGVRRIKESQKDLINHQKKGLLIYGVNTGFGALAEKLVLEKDLCHLQKNLILSHALGTGDYFEKEIIRVALFLRANALAKGFSGVRLDLISFLLELLNRDVIPLVHKKGSVGASGDLLPLAEIGLVVLGKGEVLYKGKRLKGGQALKRENLSPLRLEAKEGLSLINGTEISSAYLFSNLSRAERLLKIAGLIAGLSFLAGKANPKVLDPILMRLKPYPEQERCAKLVRDLLKGMGNGESGMRRVQDPYSFRCLPQVHGASLLGIRFASEILEKEINSVTDNPIITKDKIFTGGNFHAQPLSLAGDILAISLTTLSLISERRIFHLLTHPSLPPFLVKEPGKNSGLMMAQVLASALASENKTLSYPASVTSLPTSGNQEDFVSMSITSLSKVERIIKNLQTILSIEAICASQAIEMSRLSLKGRLLKVFRFIRQFFPFLREDREMGKEIRELADNIFSLASSSSGKKQEGRG